MYKSYKNRRNLILKKNGKKVNMKWFSMAKSKESD
jgi:hypothetical protein